MFRRWRKGSLQAAIIRSFTLLVAAVLLTMMLGLAAQTKNMIRDDAVTKTRQIVTQGNASFGVYISSTLETMALFKSLVQESEDVRAPDLIEHLRLIKRQHKDITCLSLFSKNGELLASTSWESQRTPETIREESWFQRALETRSSTVSISQPYLRENAFSGRYARVFTFSTRVEFTRMGRQETGILSMDLYFSAIENILGNVHLGSSGYLYLLGPDYELIYHKLQPLIQLEIKRENTDLIRGKVFGDFFDTMDQRERYVVVQTVDNTRWRLVGVAYMDEVTSSMSELHRMILAFLTSGILLALSVAIFMGWQITRPMNRLTRIMRVVEGGNLDVEIPQQGFLEIADLASAFQLMLERIRQLMRQIVLEQEQKRRYELDALQAQIKPHFLYNTLDSIVWMQERGQNRDAISMVTALARLFRISISKGRNIITVAEEIEHVRNYLIIQSIRFKNKFTYSINVQPETLALKTVKLVLQPLVENAIVHGLAHYMSDEGRIEISATIEQDELVMRVRDNGLGMSREMVDILLTARSKTGGIGLHNVHERITLTYGKNSGLTIESEQDAGTLITIRQPVHLEVESH